MYEELAMAEPHPNVLNTCEDVVVSGEAETGSRVSGILAHTACEILPVSGSILICSFMTATALLASVPSRAILYIEGSE